MSRAVEGRWGSREVEIVRVELRGRGGAAGPVFHSGDPMEILLALEARQPVTDVVIGVGIFNAEGVCCYGTNTDIEGAASGAVTGTGEARFAIDRLDLVAGTYKLDVAVHRRDGVPYDYHRQLYPLRVVSPVKDVGIYRPAHRWSFTGGIRITGLPSAD
jgi:hypothetical protein